MEIPGRDRLIAYRERLLQALLDPLPEQERAVDVPDAVRFPVTADASASARAGLAEREVLGHCRAAAALGVLPVVDLIAVTSVQARMLRRMAELHGVAWSTELAREFVALLGPGIASGMVGHTVGRTVCKMIPFIGQTAGVAWSARSSAIATYAIGKSADYYLGLRAAGQSASAAGLRQVHEAAGRSASREVKRLIDPDAS